MDDSLEKPHQVSPGPAEETNEDEDSGDEDGGPDWTRFPTNLVRPVIPKRGDKDFEPSQSGGSALQKHTLDRARGAMLSALGVERTSAVKNLSFAVWYPSLARAHVTLPRGVHFTSMGHSVPRPSPSLPNNKLQRRLELLPEESLYLIERGSLFCWKDEESEEASKPDGVEGTPMTVQQAFGEMVGRDELTLQKYQVYAYLRRLGYQLVRTKPPTEYYPTVPPAASAVTPLHLQSTSRTWLSRLTTTFRRLFSSFIRLFTPRLDCWRPLSIRSRFHRNIDYPWIFTSLRLIPSGHSAALNVPSPEPSSPYEVFYNVYKPSTPLKKTQLPPPDFSVVVVDAQTTPMPTLAEFSTLARDLPVAPLPRPRPKPVPNSSTAHSSRPKGAAKTTTISPLLPPARTSFVRQILGIFPAPPPTATPRPINPFMALKAGRKVVVIAAVDAGMISFFRFGEGAFEEWPMMP